MIEEHSLPKGDRGSDLSGHRKRATEREALTCWKRQRGDLSEHERSYRARGTHSLETAEGGTYLDTERIHLST